jgi:hypothetical protein
VTDESIAVPEACVTRRNVRRPPIGVLLGAVALVLSGFVFLMTLRDESGSSGPLPVQVQAEGPTFTTLDELSAASDRVVEATVVGFDDGRTITDPSDANSGLRTRLVQLDVIETFAGPATSSLVVEEEAALLDGTAIVVNGARAVDIGDSGFFFLVDGATEEFPYVAVINEQGRYLVADSGADVLIAANSSSTLAVEVEAMGADALRTALRSG